MDPFLLYKAPAEKELEKRNICSEKMTSIYQSPISTLSGILSRLFLLFKSLSYFPHFAIREENQLCKVLVPLLLPFLFSNLLINNVNDLNFRSVILNTKHTLEYSRTF